ncbi:SDR family oxidoreductase [Rothia kristinae]|uniref:SDR family oxidoreductase n=1 Tax=Rothia kristinae TaxID=37923 RepID=UPI00341D033C
MARLHRGHGPPAGSRRAVLSRQRPPGGQARAADRRGQRHRARRGHRLRPGGCGPGHLLLRRARRRRADPPGGSARSAGRPCWSPGDLTDPQHCRELVRRTVEELGGIDVLVSNAAFQMVREQITDIPDEEWDFTLATNLSAMFHLVKAAVPHMQPGSSIIGSTSVNSDMPPQQLLAYNATKAGIANMIGSLSQSLAPRGIRANSVAPGPIWTPLIPATMPEEMVEDFGGDYPVGRAGQPAELAPAYVMLAADESSYVSGARVAVTGGQPIL